MGRTTTALAACVVLPLAGCGNDAAELESPVARATISFVASAQTAVVARRGQTVAVPVATVRVPRGAQLRTTASTPGAQGLRDGRLRLAAGQRLDGATLRPCLTKDRPIRPTSTPACEPEATGPGAWTLVVLAEVSRRADLGIATISRIAFASGTRTPTPEKPPGTSTYLRDDTRYDLRDTAVSVQVIDELPAVVAPTAGGGTVDVQRDLP